MSPLPPISRPPHHAAHPAHIPQAPAGQVTHLPTRVLTAADEARIRVRGH
ncbi:hypothetical protein [Dactylosporangium salmoneum]